MIDVALLGIIRRWHLRDRVSIREVAKRLGISRNTVRRHLRSEVIEPAYSGRHTPSALDKYALKLSAWLKTEATKSRKQRRSLTQIHMDLCALGFEGSYDRVAAFARQWRVDQQERVNSASKGTPSKQKGEKDPINRYLTSKIHLRGGSVFDAKCGSKFSAIQQSSKTKYVSSTTPYNFYRIDGWQ